MPKKPSTPVALLNVETVSVASLREDPKNARTHGDKNTEVIKRSLTRFGQQKPIVVDADGVVIAGNGTLRAAISLGWKQIAVVRSSLAGDDRAAYGIADNRTAELAEWDSAALRDVLDSLPNDLRLAAGFDLDNLPASVDLTQHDAESNGGSRTVMPMQFKIVVDCNDEQHQKQLLEHFAAEGIECRALIA